MKKILLSVIALATVLVATAQDTVTVSMGANYENELYFKLSNLSENTYVAANWDIAFLRENAQSIGIRVNDGKGIQVFETANTAADFNSIDVTDEASWTPLYNDDTNWDNGAFMQGSATYGWGEYNPASHHVEGTIVFVLKYADGSYVKFINEDYFGAYTFKFATWDGAAWVNETTQTVNNSTNPDTRYNYFSLRNNEPVVAEPAIDTWDFVFRKYTTFLNPPGQYYPVTGVLHNPNVTVAQSDEDDTAIDPNNVEYLEEMNTIGYDWKNFNGSGYDIANNQKYYVKYDNETVYRLYFTEFEGSSTGNLTFVTEDVSSVLGIENVTEQVSFGMYPNPSVDGQVNIIFENIANISEKNSVAIYAMNGTKVYDKEVTNSNGFFNKTIDVSTLQSGVYLVSFTSGTSKISKKLIIK
ncbi:hypothetical protein ULMS_06330 [Patiriisocius marinistellae]|uniref:Secretion system C-terminal sorting domain-containing protein n=1 Tax=Patiriisocius marinistellae TaxID=2494560 RepID=A0A5J4FYL2_9FLAO|nr:T9SS type A sorting domain-containing protein [Patiriisocius marinistellae]GEQ85125.1 hypothetical protein ULMS_06330 [Patiriisocius marinistellae]